MTAINYPNILLDALENGVMILDEEMHIIYWNQWLEINSDYTCEWVIGQKLSDLYPSIDQRTLQRKIRTTLSLNTPTFYDTSFSNHFITIKRHKVSTSLVSEMQLQVTISPYLLSENLVMIAVYDISDLYELKIELQNKMAEIKRLNSLLEQENERVETLAVTDPLTRLFNRYKLNDVLENMIKRKHWTQDNSFALVIVDIDFFKKVNDTYGHQVGDAVLVTIANTLRETVRIGDFIGRWGGEEFVVILPNVDEKQALLAVEKLRYHIQEAKIEEIDRGITASFGIAIYTEGDTQEELIHRADNALYLAKESGRNCVKIA